MDQASTVGVRRWLRAGAVAATCAALVFAGCTRTLHDDRPPRPPLPPSAELHVNPPSSTTTDAEENDKIVVSEEHSIIDEVGIRPEAPKPADPRTNGVAHLSGAESAFIVQSGK